MKRVLVIVIIVIAFVAVAYFLFLRRTPYSIAANIAGFKISSSLIVEQFNDDWANNPGGDGESFVLFSLKKDEKEKLINDCKINNYTPLPIKDILPDGFIYNYIGKKNQSGFYKLSIDKKDKRNYQITVLDLQQKKLLVYNIIY